MNFSKIQASTKRLFTFLGPYKGDNQLATLHEINQVFDRLNNLFPYRMHDIEITQTGTNAPSFVKLAAGATECPSNCSSGVGNVCICDCKSPCANEKAGAFSVSAAYVSEGIYDFTFTLDPTIYPNAIKNVGFFFTPFETPLYTVSVKQINANVYRVKTYNGGIVSNTIFKNTPVAMKIYF
jgi:hypothetical protein